MDIQQEINKHLEWMDRVVAVLGDEQLTEAEITEISRHDLCALGQWLDSDETAIYRNLAVFKSLKKGHEAFHKLAAELIVTAKEGKETEAMDAQENFIALSQQVIKDLTELQQHAS